MFNPYLDRIVSLSLSLFFSLKWKNSSLDEIIFLRNVEMKELQGNDILFQKREKRRKESFDLIHIQTKGIGNNNNKNVMIRNRFLFVRVTRFH